MGDKVEPRREFIQNKPSTCGIWMCDMMSSNRNTRERLIALLQTNDIADAARSVGISETHAKTVWKKSCEIEIASRFLIERGMGISDIMSLEEFAGVDGCPDVVAMMDSGPVGIELTAYTSNEPLNQLSNLMLQISEVVFTELANGYLDLNGCCIRYSPNKENVLHKRDLRSFAIELLNFARFACGQHNFSDGNPRLYPELNCRNPLCTFNGYTLLQQHLAAVFIDFPPWNAESPVYISPGGIATHFGTSTEVVREIILRKKGKRINAHKEGLRAVWLLVHATGNPISSRIAPIRQNEMQSLLTDSLVECATDSGFDRVFVWDGVRGGSVELISGDAHFVAPG